MPYDIKVIVKDRKGNTASKEMTLTVKPALANTSSVRSTSIKLGDPINITGSASGGSGSYKYSYYFKQASKSGWTTKTANTSSSSVSITPSLAVDYNIKVTVTDSTGKTASKTFTVKVNPTAIVNNSAVQSTSIMLGSTINVSASASGGNGSYKYSYYFKQAANSSWTTKAANTAAKTVTIKPSQAVDYNVKVVVLDTDGRSASKIFTVKVNTPPLTNKSSVKSTAIKLGNTIDITAAAEGGSGSYKYSYYFKQASGSAWTAKSTNTTAASVSIKPSKAVSYNVKVVVTDSKGTTSTKTFTVSVTKSTLANNSSAASSSIKLGNTINITALASGGAKPYKYSYYFKQAANSGWTAKATNTTASSISIKPSQAVDYNIKVVVTDAEGAVSEKAFTVKVTK